MKKWIAHSEGFAKGELRLNRKAADAVRGDRAVSILPVGVAEVKGEFEKDDIVRITGEDGGLIGVGRVGVAEPAQQAHAHPRGDGAAVSLAALAV